MLFGLPKDRVCLRITRKPQPGNSPRASISMVERICITPHFRWEKDCTLDPATRRCEIAKQHHCWTMTDLTYYTSGVCARKAFVVARYNRLWLVFFVYGSIHRRHLLYGQLNQLQTTTAPGIYGRTCVLSHHHASRLQTRRAYDTPAFQHVALVNTR